MKKRTETLVGVAEWRRFIEDRLSGRLVEPPVPTRSEDGPETYLVNQYADSTEDKKALIQAATLELLQAARRETVPAPWLGHLFQFVRIARITSVGDQLVALFLADSGRGNPLRKAKGAWQASQLHELMHAIRDLQPAKGPLAWREYLDDPDLAQYAFYGLVESDLDAAVTSLPRINALAEAGIRVSPKNSIAYLIAYWREKRPDWEPVAYLLHHFYFENSILTLRLTLDEIPSASPYLDAYLKIERESVGCSLIDCGEFRQILFASSRMIPSRYREVWQVVQEVRKLLHCSPVLDQYRKQLRVYDSTYTIFEKVKPRDFLRLDELAA